ncbi:serine kinase HipA [Pseudomonas syringae pv. actinidiae ICMP 19073]|uniref:serine kinase HipA n=1 Tax=Pseudomonas syringae TaxID=317 RepID=UPI0003580F00|nr:serine kinase HipA [Pseudomonas syringae]EPM63363.1 serine kinase HipA [Pseudomonas syringae pv. actinidiae ICMP 19073]
MLEQVNVFYEGWGERWQWGTLASTTALTGRPLIVFEYSNEARQKGLELSRCAWNPHITIGYLM